MTKQELKRYRRMEIELEQLESTIRRLEDSVTGVRAAVITDMPKGGPPVEMADRVAKLLDLKEVYGRKWDALIDERTRIESAIDTLNDPIERALMRYKYIDGLTWEEVCVKIGYEWAQTHRLHGRILAKMIHNDTL